MKARKKLSQNEKRLVLKLYHIRRGSARIKIFILFKIIPQIKEKYRDGLYILPFFLYLGTGDIIKDFP